MAEINLINKNTLTRTVRNVAIVATAAISVVAGGIFLKDCSQKSTSKDNVEIVRKALSEGKDNYADNLFNEMSKGGSLIPAHKVELTFELKKNKGLKELEQKINAYDANAAYNSLNNLKASQLINDDEIKGLEQKIFQITEKGLYQKIKDANPEHKMVLCDNYLKVYQNGPNRKLIISELLKNELNNYAASLNAKEPSSSISKKSDGLITRIEKYSSEKISLPDEIVSKVIKNANNYVFSFKRVPLENELSLGDFVEVNNTSSQRWDEQFKKERDKTIPKGSFGKVVGIENNHIFIQFNGITEYAWTQDWNPTANYWKNGRKNVADYELKEIMINVSLSEKEKSKFNSDAAKISNLLKHYK
jgi:hypothetical protein